MFRCLATVMVLSLLCGWSAASGAIILQFDMDTDAPGIQSGRNAAPGDEFFIDVLLGLTDSSFITPSFSLNVTYDTSHVEVLSAVATADFPNGPRPTGWNQVSPLTFSAGTVGPFDGTGTSLLTAPQDFSLGRIRLRTSNLGSIPTTSQLLTFVPGTGLTGATTIAGPSTLVVSAIPEPTVSLLGLAALFPVGVARCRARWVQRTKRLV